MTSTAVDRRGVFSVYGVDMTSVLMKLTNMPVASLIAYANNSRTHDESQVNQIAASIKEFGFNNPVLIDESNGIIAGHGRVLAANVLGLKEVPTISLPHLSDAQKKAYIIADNSLALNAEWNWSLLDAEIAALEELDFDISLLGLETNDVDGVDFPDLPDGDKEPFQQKTLRFTMNRF